MAQVVQALEISQNRPGRIFTNVLLFMVFFVVVMIATYLVRLFTLGLYKKRFNIRLLRKYVEAQQWMNQ